MPHPISEKVLQEILRAFAWEEASLPSEDALRELAAARGHTHETIKNAYTRAYQGTQTTESKARYKGGVLPNGT
jgi:hypothetical protein